MAVPKSPGATIVSHAFRRFVELGPFGNSRVGWTHSHVVCTVGRSLVQAQEHALQRVLERLPEVPIEVRVDERVQGRIEVADPEQHGDQHVRTRTGVAAQRRRHVPGQRNEHI